jgi:hypothetical protein
MIGLQGDGWYEGAAVYGMRDDIRKLLEMLLLEESLHCK